MSTRAVADAAAEAAKRDRPEKPAGFDPSRLLHDLMSVGPVDRAFFMSDLSARDRTVLFDTAHAELGTPYGLWRDDPVGFAIGPARQALWSLQRTVLRSVQATKKTAVPSTVGIGKCWGRDERIVLATGETRCAGDLVGTEFEVMAYVDGKQVRRWARAAWNTIEPVYALETDTGRRIVRNGEHPLLAATRLPQGGPGTWLAAGVVPRGWVPVRDLAAGELVLAPDQHGAEGYRRVDPREVVLAGYLLGDGCARAHSVSFSQQPGPCLDEFRELVESYGCDLRHRSRVDYDVTTPRGQPNPVLQLTQGWGMAGVTAPAKRLPAWAWSLPNDQLALLLNRLFACDGWVYVNPELGAKRRRVAHVAIALASEALIRDVETVMLRLGVVGRVRHRRVKYDGGHRDAWEWCAATKDAVRRFAEVVGIKGKEAVLARAAALAAEPTGKTRRWHRLNAPDGFHWERVRSVTALPAQMTVAIEVEDAGTYVGDFVEHNTRIGGVLTAWWGSVWPAGTATVLTTATRFRQVKTQLWPEIRAVHAHASLPGHCDTTQWKIPTEDGVDFQAAFGFSAPDWDETAVQGMHRPRLLVIVDEAGGFGHVLGQAFESILTGEHTRALFIGNPPTDTEGSWFEGLCAQPDTNTIPISIFDTPRFTGEEVGTCTTCPRGMPEHDAAEHLTEPEWEQRIRRDYGEDSPYYQARALARFPKGGPSRAIPGDWIDAAVEKAKEGTDDRRAVVGDRNGVPFPFQPKAGAWIRLGVDVAAGGGDELAIARCEGDVVRVVHTESGRELAKPHYAAGKVLEQIRVAEALRRRLGTKARVRVKIDANGVGIGCAGVLEAWADEGIHEAVIIRVNVGESPEDGRRDAHETMRPKLKRDEMYLAMRHLLQPDERTGDPAVALDIDTQTRAQLAAAKIGWGSGGLTTIEPKDKIKERLQRSPDRAEAVMLAVYEPYDLRSEYRRTIISGA